MVDFSVPYFGSDIAVLSRADKLVDDKTIKDVTVGVQQATTGAAFATDKLKLTKVQVYPEQGDMFTALRAGQIDAAITDTSIVLAEEVNSQGKVKVVGQYKTGESYGALYPKAAPTTPPSTRSSSRSSTTGRSRSWARSIWPPSGAKTPPTFPSGIRKHAGHSRSRSRRGREIRSNRDLDRDQS